MLMFQKMGEFRVMKFPNNRGDYLIIVGGAVVLLIIVMVI